MDWLPAADYWRKKAAERDYVPDDTPLPEALKARISSYYQRTGLKINKPTWAKLGRFLNHLWTSPDHEARMGIQFLQKMGFGRDARKHIAHLKAMWMIDEQGYCPAAGVSKLFRLRKPAWQFFEDKPASDAL